MLMWPPSRNRPALRGARPVRRLVFAPEGGPKWPSRRTPRSAGATRCTALRVLVQVDQAVGAAQRHQFVVGDRRASTGRSHSHNAAAHPPSAPTLYRDSAPAAPLHHHAGGQVADLLQPPAGKVAAHRGGQREENEPEIRNDAIELRRVLAPVAAAACRRRACRSTLAWLASRPGAGRPGCGPADSSAFGNAAYAASMAAA